MNWNQRISKNPVVKKNIYMDRYIQILIKQRKLIERVSSKNIYFKV